MPNEGFLQRWSRLKTEPPAPAAPPPVVVAPAPEPIDADAPLPTLADAAQLDAQSDYSAFVGRAVDPDVRRLAMKKLFADPHFNVIDGLDIYMADYNLPSPVSAEMLASLTHALSVFPRAEEEGSDPGSSVGGQTPVVLANVEPESDQPRSKPGSDPQRKNQGLTPGVPDSSNTPPQEAA
jgi:hypothetical protein